VIVHEGSMEDESGVARIFRVEVITYLMPCRWALKRRVAE